MQISRHENVRGTVLLEEHVSHVHRRPFKHARQQRWRELNEDKHGISSLPEVQTIKRPRAETKNSSCTQRQKVGATTRTLNLTVSYTDSWNIVLTRGLRLEVGHRQQALFARVIQHEVIPQLSANNWNREWKHKGHVSESKQSPTSGTDVLMARQTFLRAVSKQSQHPNNHQSRTSEHRVPSSHWPWTWTSRWSWHLPRSLSHHVVNLRFKRGFKAVFASWFWMFVEPLRR